MLGKFVSGVVVVCAVAGTCGVTRGESRNDSPGLNQPTNGMSAISVPSGAMPDSAMALQTRIPDSVADFLNNSPVPTDLNRSPHEILQQKTVIAPPAESQMVPLPPGVWTGMSGLLGLGFFRVAKGVKRKVR